MKQRIIALVALIVSLCAFAYSVVALFHSMGNGYKNMTAYIFQLVAVLIIVVICAANYISILQKDVQENDE